MKKGRTEVEGMWGGKVGKASFRFAWKMLFYRREEGKGGASPPFVYERILYTQEEGNGPGQMLTYFLFLNHA